MTISNNAHYDDSIKLTNEMRQHYVETSMRMEIGDNDALRLASRGSKYAESSCQLEYFSV